MPPIDFGIDPVLDAIDARLEMGASQPLVSMLPASTGGTGREMMAMLAAMIAQHPEPSVPRSVPPQQTDDGSTAAAVTAGLGAVAASVAAIGSAVASSQGGATAKPPSPKPDVPSASSFSGPSGTGSSTGTAGDGSAGTEDVGAAVDRAMASYDAAHSEPEPEAERAEPVRTTARTSRPRVEPAPVVPADPPVAEAEAESEPRPEPRPVVPPVEAEAHPPPPPPITEFPSIDLSDPETRDILGEWIREGAA